MSGQATTAYGIYISAMDATSAWGIYQVDARPNYFAGEVGIGSGTDWPSNILTVQQGSGTDPIADAWTVYSSIRWKENISSISSALEKIDLLNPVYFDWKEGYGQGHDLGFIAEEVGKVIPEVVAWEEDGVWAKSISYGKLSSLAIAGIKEQQKQISSISSQLSSNESENYEVISHL